MKIWLDDVRPKPDEYDLHVRSEKEAIDALHTHGHSVTEISLDCDLGVGYGCGYNVALWLTGEWDQERLQHIKVLCHSGNPVEAAAVVRLVARARERQRTGDW